MSKVTPGPWNVRTVVPFIGKALGGHDPQVAVCGPDNKPIVAACREGVEITPDISLIAAAPNLLEACQRVLTYLGEFDSDSGPVATCMNKLEFAISKAEGAGHE